MSAIYHSFSDKFEVSNGNNMKAIFKSIAGMILITALFMFFGVFIQLYVPELEPIALLAKGFVFIILLMGIAIILKSSIAFIYGSRLKESV